MKPEEKEVLLNALKKTEEFIKENDITTTIVIVADKSNVTSHVSGNSGTMVEVLKSVFNKVPNLSNVFKQSVLEYQYDMEYKSGLPKEEDEGKKEGKD